MEEDELNNENQEGSILDTSDLPSGDTIEIISDIDTDLRIQDVITGGQAEIAALKKEVKDLETKLRSAERAETKAKDESKRESQKSKKILDEKRNLLEKLKSFEAMFDGIDMDTAKEVLRRAKEGEVSSFESEAAIMIESALLEFKETHHNPLVDELEEERKTNEILRTKLHNAVVKSAIVNQAITKGVNPELADFVVPYFERKMRINERGDMKFITREGYETDSFDWDGSFLLLKNEKPSLFLSSKGSRANAATDIKSVSRDVNPWMKGSIDRVLQMRILSQDSERAEKLKAEAKKAKAK